MSTNGINACEDAEMADCEDEKVVTMMDVLKEQEDFEEDANAVLGASDDKNCTYTKGYVKRQAIYACMTCCADAKNDPSKWAGVCLACSLTCHENHDLIELYTKRNFRCDCGNPKFNSHPCQFTPNKTDLNPDNTYNQNFSGVYCICHRPYPDPESNDQEEMIQCIICEDWLHSNHLDALVPSNEQYSEMICKACMDKNEFLHDYNELAVNKEDNMDVDILNTSSKSNTTSNCNDTDLAVSENNASSNQDIAKEEIENLTVVEKSNDPVKTEKLDGSVMTSASSEEQESAKEDESAVETSENNAAPSISTEDIEAKGDQKNETVKKNDTQPEETKPSADATQESIDNSIKEKSELEGEALPVANAVTSDTRSQEQVEEDMLLADPVDTVLDQKVDIAPSITNQSSTDGSANEEKSESTVMDVSASENEIKNTENKEGGEDESKSSDEKNIEQLDTVSTVEESGIETTNDESQNASTMDQSENVTPVTNTDEAFTDKLQNDLSAEIQAESGQTENAGNIEQPENILDIKQELSDSVSTIEKPEQEEKNINEEKIVSENKENTPSEENNSQEKSSAMDVAMNDDNTHNAVSDEIRTNQVELNCDNKVTDKALQTDINKRKLSTDSDTENVEVKRPKLDESKCIRPRGVKKIHHGATFWPSNFRQKLCTCNECISMYKDLSVLFLTDPEDTVTAYERLGEEKSDGKPASQYEKGMAALSSLGRVQQINALTEYAKLRDKLLDFLKTFKDKKVIVKEEDIKAFFAGMKPVREPDGVYFCR